MNKKRILIFGAGGFMGTYLSDHLLNNGYEVVASDYHGIGKEYYDSKRVQYYDVDISKEEEFKKLPECAFDAVVHLAATQPANVSEKTYDPKNYITVNVIGTLNILNYCRKNNCGRIVYATSHRNTQGMWERKNVISEEDGRSIKYTGQYSMFSISETAAQDCVLHYQAEYGLKGIILRLPPVYGYGPHTEIFMNGKPIKTGFQIFIDNSKECKPLVIWGDANKGRDIVYVKDVIDAFHKAIENPDATGLYNISSGYKLTLQEEAEVIADLFWGDDTKPIIENAPEKPNNIDEFVYDISKAERELGWKPKYDFRTMLIDIAKEGQDKRFSFLVDKRHKMFEDDK